MPEIEKVDHAGIRVRDKAASVAFRGWPGFGAALSNAGFEDAGFEKGRPVPVRHGHDMQHMQP